MSVAYSVLAQSQPRTNVDAATWSTRVSFGGFPKINAVTFGANPYNRPLFLSGDNAGAVKLSEDGVVWQDSVAVTSQPINALVYAPNYNSVVNSLNFWILGANNGIISTSTDAVTWTSRTSGFAATVPVLALAYGEGTYVAAGGVSAGVGTLTTSTDGITWTTRTSNTVNSILCMTYAVDHFVGGTNGSGVITSDDGFTWTSRSAGFGTSAINAITFGNGIFVAGDDIGRINVSTNAITWTSRPTIHNIRALTFADGIFFAGGTNGALSTSTDAITWTTRQSAFNTGLAINGMAFGNNALALVGDGHTVNSAILESVQDVYTVPAASNVVLSSITVTNPTNRDVLADVYLRSAACFNVGPWVPKTLTVATTQINSIAFGGNQYITAGNNGQVRTSTDTTTWVERFPLGFGTSNVNAVTVGSNTSNRVVFAVGGVGGRLSISTDSVVWTSGPSGFGSNNITSLTFGLSTFIAGGENGTLTTSTDAVTWTARTSGFGFTQIRSITFGSGLFVAAGDSGTLTTSTNGTTWTTRVSQFGTTPIFATTFGNNTYVAGGGSGALSTSTDGITWVSRPAVATVVNNANITALTFGDNLFVLGTSGAGGARIATSSDGITWTSRRTVAGYTGFRAAGYGNGVYLVGDETGVLALNDKNFVNKPANALVFRQPIKARDVKAFTVGATLSAGDVISVESSVSTTLTFHAFGGRDF